jgi:hypothetical protein
VEPFHSDSDPFFKQQADDWGKQTGVNTTVETINANDLTPRFTAAIQFSRDRRFFRCSTWLRIRSPKGCTT